MNILLNDALWSGVLGLTMVATTIACYWWHLIENGDKQF